MCSFLSTGMLKTRTESSIDTFANRRLAWDGSSWSNMGWGVDSVGKLPACLANTRTTIKILSTHLKVWGGARHKGGNPCSSLASYSSQLETSLEICGGAVKEGKLPSGLSMHITPAYTHVCACMHTYTHTPHIRSWTNSFTFNSKISGKFLLSMFWFCFDFCL